MPADKDPLVGLEEIARLLETHEGPNEARWKPTAPSRTNVRWTGAVAAGALLVGSGLGFGVGSSLPEDGNAARASVGLGFLPQDGWTVLGTGARATFTNPSFALAANVPLSRDEAGGLPYATLLSLPHNGAVIFAAFGRRQDGVALDPSYPARKLPLRLRDAVPHIEFSTQIRPNRPLGQYQLRATVNGHTVDLQIYFGSLRPSRALLESTQRQLDQLVVEGRANGNEVVQRALPLRPAPQATPVSPAAKVIDRTMSCRVGMQAGARVLFVGGTSSTRRNSQTQWLGAISVSTGSSALPSDPTYRPSLAGVSAGWPPPPNVGSGGLSFSASVCKLVRTNVALSPSHLSGGYLGGYGDQVQCFPPRTVLIRVRARFFRSTTLKLRRGDGYSAVGRMQRGQIAVRTPKGKALVYGEVLDSGNAKLLTADGCF